MSHSEVLHAHAASFRVREGGNYRVALASLLPAAQFAFVLLIWPIISYNPAPPSDLELTAPSVAPEFLLTKLAPPAFGLLALGLLLACRPTVRRDMRLTVGLVLLFLGFAAASSLWALAPIQVLIETTRLSLLYLCVAVGCMSARSMDDVLRPVLYVFAAAIFLNTFAVVLLPTSPIGHPGIYGHKNTFGLVAALAILLLIPGIARRRTIGAMLTLIGLGLSVAFVVVSQSKTSMALALVAPLICAGLFLIRRLLRISLSVGFVLGLLLLGAIYAIAAALWNFSVADISMAISGEPTFTGRMELWAFMLDGIAERPLLGHGYQSFWMIGQDAPAIAMPGFIGKATHGHNGVLDMLIHLGIAGCVIVAAMLLAVWNNLGRLADGHPRIAFLVAGMLVFLLLHEMLESSIFNPLDPSAVMFALVLFLPLVNKSARPHHAHRVG